ncbi:hypothetical protein [uncultured Chryseobacterium sp.]|uniref:hypothetical protein n=1 Tax=uncultured Chryseobacterium sp. TaxID=259322 RepID=UPI0025E3E457|nr:hypothetical protein [uncultured Chryseobacterium sp.]
MKQLLLFLFVSFMLTACGETCYNAPQPIAFKLVNANNENLITNGMLTNYSVKEQNQKTKTGEDLLILENVGAYNGTKNYAFTSNLRNFTFTIQSSEFKGGCDGYQINKLTFTGIGIDVKDENGYYKIILE